MDAAKRKRLEARGWRVGDAQEFLGLSDAEAAFVDIKARVAMAFAERRREGFTQIEAAKLIGSSQSRVAKMEKGDPSVSLDLLVRALLALGATAGDLTAAIGKHSARRPKRGRTPVRARGRAAG
jgi:DNA-binding XRE family transcriptional regulator